MEQRVYYNNVDSRAYELNILDSSTSSINSRYPNGGSTTFFLLFMEVTI